MQADIAFGTDGVRGAANIVLTSEVAFRLGQAAGRCARNEVARRVRVVIGADPRRSSTMLSHALSAGFCSIGVDVDLLGVAPTPAAAYAVIHGEYDLGVVVSASHNASTDNGIKFFGPTGRKLPGDVENAIAAEYRVAGGELAPAAEIGMARTAHGALASYVDFLAATLGDFGEHFLGGWEVALDCANGAAFEIGPRVFERLGAKVHRIGCKPDGDNINGGVGSTCPEAMLDATRRLGCAIGIAFDGDADRVLLADERGRRIDGDRVLALWAVYELAQKRLSPAVVVGTTMSNSGFERYLSEHGIRLIRAQNGDRYVVEQMEAHHALVGGEQSGHVVFSRRSTTGDGILTALEVIRVMLESGKTLSELAFQYETWPQRLVNLSVAEGPSELPLGVRQTVCSAERLLEDRGRVNVRRSGTEPVVRVMIEAMSEDLMHRALEMVVPVVEREMGGEVKSTEIRSDDSGS